MPPLATSLPIGYAVTVVVFATAAMLALAPPRRPRPLAKVGFLVGTVVNEMPLLYLLWLLAATALAFEQGSVGSLAAWVAVGLAALTAFGLLLLIGRALRTGAIVVEALEDGLDGALPAQRAIEAARRKSERWPAARAVAAPWLIYRNDVWRLRDIAYAEAGKQNLLDVYRHRSLPSRSPALVYLHGGGYFGGGKSREARALLYRLASRGWTCVSANYRLRPEARLSDHLVDAKKVLAWVREHARELGVDPAHLMVAGSSAGGHLAAFLALTPNDPALQPGFEDADTSTSGAICLYGYLGRYYGQGPKSSPRSHIHSGAPPFFIAQGKLDTYSPRFVSIAREFAKQLQAASSNPVVYAELPGAQHGFDLLHSIRFEAVINGIEAFTSAVIDREKAQPLTQRRAGETRVPSPPGA